MRKYFKACNQHKVFVTTRYQPAFQAVVLSTYGVQVDYPNQNNKFQNSLLQEVCCRIL